MAARARMMTWRRRRGRVTAVAAREWWDSVVFDHAATFETVAMEAAAKATTYFYGGFDGGDSPPVFDQVPAEAGRRYLVRTTYFGGGGTTYLEIRRRCFFHFKIILFKQISHI